MQFKDFKKDSEDRTTQLIKPKQDIKNLIEKIIMEEKFQKDSQYQKDKMAQAHNMTK